MNEVTINKVRELESQVSNVVAGILEQKPCLLYAELKIVDNGETVLLAGNSEGLVYLASLLLSLAVEQKEAQHVHLGEGEVLDQCDKGLVLAFKNVNGDAT